MVQATIVNDGVSAGVAALKELSFTGTRADGGVDLWSHDVRGDWRDQCSAGREFGREACEHMRETSNAALLPGIARAIATRGDFGGVEVGFFTAVALALAS